MKLKVNRDYALLISREYLPNFLAFSKQRENRFTVHSDDHWNCRIITGVIQSLVNKFNLKIIVTEKNCITFKFTDAEVYTLYKCLLNYPIPQHKDYECMMRDLFVAKLHQYITTPTQFQTYNLLK